MSANATSYLNNPKFQSIQDWILDNSSKSSCGFTAPVERTIIMSIFLSFSLFKSKHFMKIFNCILTSNDLATSLDPRSLRIVRSIQGFAGALVNLRDLYKDLNVLTNRYKREKASREAEKKDGDQHLDENLAYYNDAPHVSLADFGTLDGISIVDRPNQDFSVDLADISRASELIYQYFEDLKNNIIHSNLFHEKTRQRMADIKLPGAILLFAYSNNVDRIKEVDVLAVQLRLKKYLKRCSEIWWLSFNMSAELTNFSGEEIEQLFNCIYTYELMVKCRNSAVRVSGRFWKLVEERILLKSATES